MKKKISVMMLFTLVATILLIFVSITSAFICQNDNGYIDNLDIEKGYTLFSPERSQTTYLINYGKEVVQTWKSDYTPGHSAYLLENGNLLRPVFLGAHPVFLSGGMGGGVQEFDWNGTVLWDFKYSGDTYLSHHDIEPLPNGNILMIAWEQKTLNEAISAGRNPESVSVFGVWPDYIIEVKPTGPTTGDIVWEWHVWDHLIQDFDQTKENYGVVENHPELIDINFGVTNPDWLHTNSIDYNDEFDQILLSVHNFHEVWVIDHSTTTEEAAGHTGGNSGKGGDILYRWGNPRTYRAGGSNDQKLFGQHDARWIEPGFPGEGNILVFNNGLGRPEGKYSSVDEIVPPVDDYGNYFYTTGLAYGPEDPIWIYTAENPTDFYSSMISGAQRIANGNTVICNGKKGIFFEVTYEKETIWEYTNPYPIINANAVFKIERYPSNYPGLANLMQQPINPDKPNGITYGENGKEYNYTSFSYDPQEDQIYYWFDWGDGTNSGWLGPYNSGENVTASHIWTRRWIYDIKVKAKDIYGHESGWSESLTVYIPRNRIIDLPILRFFEKHPILFNLLKLFL
ncbi:MAG: aryl-sulfate sulfotransferase [Thermoplasmatales archaeon]|nr:MAG: aryl-sulfate sulfotransferase [Thermoplasmatales archaeon]